jgi:hypothetical protein
LATKHSKHSVTRTDLDHLLHWRYAVRNLRTLRSRRFTRGALSLRFVSFTQTPRLCCTVFTPTPHLRRNRTVRALHHCFLLMMGSCQRRRRCTRSRWLDPPLDRFCSVLFRDHHTTTTAPPFETRSISALVAFPALFSSFRGLRSFLWLLCNRQSQFALQTSLKEILGVCWRIVVDLLSHSPSHFGHCSFFVAIIKTFDSGQVRLARNIQSSVKLNLL